jgi:hypothetical protein
VKRGTWNDPRCNARGYNYTYFVLIVKLSAVIIACQLASEDGGWQKGFIMGVVLGRSLVERGMPAGGSQDPDD